MHAEQGELFKNPHRKDGEGAIEYAARRTIEALRQYNALDATHSLKVELILAGSRALDYELTRDKVTVAATTLFSRVVDIADGLPDVKRAVTTEFERMVAALDDAD